MFTFNQLYSIGAGFGVYPSRFTPTSKPIFKLEELAISANFGKEKDSKGILTERKAPHHEKLQRFSKLLESYSQLDKFVDMMFFNKNEFALSLFYQVAFLLGFNKERFCVTLHTLLFSCLFFHRHGPL